MSENKLPKIRWFERNPGKTIIFTIVIAIFMMDFSIANIYKFTMGYSWGYRAQAKQERLEKRYRIKSNIYGHELAKNYYTQEAMWGGKTYTVCTNSLGFKDKAIREIPLASSRRRIVFIGDSFTEGVGITYDKTFAGLVDKELSKKGIEALNAGVEGYSPIIYWRKIKYLIENIGLKFDELVVFLDISDIGNEAVVYGLDGNGNVLSHDMKDYIEKNKSIKSRIKEAIKNNSILTYSFLNKIYDLVSPKGGCGRRILWTTDEKMYQEFGMAGIERMGSYMGRLYDLLEQHDIKLTVAVYPWPGQIINNEVDSIWALFWQDWCQRHNVNFLNYFPYFIDPDLSEERERLISKYFIEGDDHWNEDGHKLIADTFLSYYNKGD
jgi:hypothetical protein